MRLEINLYKTKGNKMKIEFITCDICNPDSNIRADYGVFEGDREAAKDCGWHTESEYEFDICPDCEDIDD